MRNVLLVAAAAALFGVLVVRALLAESAVACEACVEFEGRRACGTVAAAERGDAEARAVSMACGKVTQGVTRTLACERRPPASLSCRDAPLAGGDGAP